MATREGVQVTPTLCHPCGRHKDRCRCAGRADHIAALKAIAANGYGLQGIQEDYGGDANAYNYHARRYFASELFRKEQIARRALANGAP
jgi:hypothetical protein